MEGMLENPGARKMMEERFRVEFAYQFRPLFEELQLSDKKKHHLEELMLAKMMSGLETSMDALGSDDPFAAEDLWERTKTARMLNEEIKGLLGAKDFERYERFSETMKERAAVNLLQQRLRLRGASLTEEQAEQLIDFMHEESKAAVARSRKERGGATMAAGETLTQKLAAMQGKQVEQLDRTHELVLERAAEILSEQQLAELKATQEQERRTVELQVQFAEKFLQGGNREQPP
jgi:hypothetical protein